jgi:glycosyltransferase involved in cell wall biosynthesis
MLKTISYWAFTPFALRWISHKFGDFDIVHSNGISDLTLSKYISSKPRVVTAHHLARSHVEVVKPSRKHRLTHPGDELGLVPYLESVSYRRADCIVAVSEHTKSELISKLGIEPKKIKVIRHGANRGDYLFPLEELTLIRNEIGVGTPHMLLCVGRLEPRKGIDTLLSSFALIKQVTNATLVIVGSGSQIILRNLAKNLDIEDRVIFLGYVDDIKLRKLFAACDLFILPSLLEGLGIVALEARAAGKFVVASDVGGIPEAVPPSSGILVPPGEVNQLAEAIKTGLNNQYDNFPPVRSWNETGAELCAFYEEVFQDSTKLSTSK